MITNKWTLSLSVKLIDVKSLSNLDSESMFQIGALNFFVKESSGYFVLEARNFDSENEAVAYLPNLKNGLWSLAIERGIAFVPFYEQQHITRPDDPDLAARSLEEIFKLPYSGPVHGLTNREGFCVYQTGENIRYVNAGDIRAFVTTPWGMVEKALRKGIECGGCEPEEIVNTALELYLMHFSESSIRAKFLNLIMALEVLAPYTEKHAVVVEMLNDFSSKVQSRIESATDGESLEALQSLLNELKFKKGISIRQRVRRLFLDCTQLPEVERQEWARKIVKAYDLRSELTHEGFVDGQKLNQAYSVALDAVKLILGAHLRLSTM